jgi:hypothetical protein
MFLKHTEIQMFGIFNFGRLKGENGHMSADRNNERQIANLEISVIKYSDINLVFHFLFTISCKYVLN